MARQQREPVSWTPRARKLAKIARLGGILAGSVAAATAAIVVVSHDPLENVGTGLGEGDVVTSDSFETLEGDSTLRLGVDGASTNPGIVGYENSNGTAHASTYMELTSEDGQLLATVSADNMKTNGYAPTTNGMFVEVDGQRIDLEDIQSQRTDNVEMAEARVGDLSQYAEGSTFTVVFGQQFDSGEVTSVPYTFIDNDGPSFSVIEQTPGQDLPNSAVLYNGQAQNITGQATDFGPSL